MICRDAVASKKFDVKNKLSESYCQTNSTVVSDGATQTLKTNDTPCEPLLQKFGSQVCFKKSQSMPTLYFQGAIFLQIRYGFRMEKYSHILNWCGTIFIKGHTCNRECRRDCSFTKLVNPLTIK